MPNGVAKKIIATKKVSNKKIFKEVQIIIFFLFLFNIYSFICLHWVFDVAPEL